MISSARDELKRLLAAVQFFTQIPVPGWVGHSQEQLNAAVRYFPAVGLLVGLMSALIYELAHRALPDPIAILLSMAFSMLLTGAFHEDGLADAVDGFGGSYTAEKALIIMKDSRIGTYGACALIGVLLLKWQALSALAPSLVFSLLVAGHTASRAASVWVMRTLPYVREDDTSRAKPLVQQVSRVSLTVALLTSLFALVLVGYPALVGVGALLIVTLVAIRYFRYRIGGYTGDCLGAVQQLAEVSFYLGALGYAHP